MPELPEVETVRRQLADGLRGVCFGPVLEAEPFMLSGCSVERLRDELPGRSVRAVERVGKFLVLSLGGGSSADSGQSADGGGPLTLHLGMTGRVLLASDDEVADMTHVRFVFSLSPFGAGRVSRISPQSVRVLVFSDARKFGRVGLGRADALRRLGKLGPDAWQGAWSAEYLARILAGRTVPLKAFLLDQRHLAGIGNIYADEILWASGLSPLRPAGSLGAGETERLAGEIRRVLGEGVRFLGCSISDFVDTEGRSGSFQRWLRAYGRHGQACYRCGLPMVRVVVGGRGTCLCLQCQQ